MSRDMFIDVTGIELTPGNNGLDCLGDGQHKDEDGNVIECCCDECNFLMCCLSEHTQEECISCKEEECPRKCVAEK